MQESRIIKVIVNRLEVEIKVNKILYVLMRRKYADIHIAGGRIYETRTTFAELERELDERFIKVRRGCIVSAMAIHDVTDRINLSNGESLDYTVRKKRAVINELRTVQKNIISSFSEEGVPVTAEEYRRHYSGFDNMPFAFTDIEMIFSEESHAVDWIFRYGNEALAKLEKLPLEQLIGSTFGSLFSNMDSKWLRNYERAALYGETLEIIDYSPEIDTYLKVICFPTFDGHCGCILFDINGIEFARNTDSENALFQYFGRLPAKNV
ncbi:MAG: LytTR family transcriptional regulator DNA-binding domain-containing protein [Porcipelethomonas sp.]